ncbi:MAG: hypothetical protein ABJ275_06260 [Maricaulaceae bacterium]
MKRSVVFTSAVCMTACGTIPNIQPHFQHTAVHFNKVASDTNNELILLNILRAKNRQPLYYSTISELRGVLSYGGSVGVGSTLNSQGLSSSAAQFSRPNIADTITETTSRGLDVFTPNAAINVSSNPSFNYEILDTQEFYRGITTSIPTEIVANYLEQGWGDQLLAALLIENVTFNFQVVEMNSNGSYVVKEDNVGNLEIVVKDLTNNSSDISEKGFGHLIKCTQLSPTTNSGTTNIDVNLPADFNSFEGLSGLSSGNWEIKSQKIKHTSSSSKTIRLEYKEADDSCKTFEYLTTQPLVRTDKEIDFSEIDGMFENMINAGFKGRVNKLSGDLKYRVIPQFRLRSTQSMIYFIGEYLRQLDEFEADGSMNKTGPYAINNLCLFQTSKQRVKNNFISAELGDEKVYIPAYKANNSPTVLTLSCNPKDYSNGAGNKNIYNTMAFINQMINLQKSAENRPRTITVNTVP